MTDIEAIKARHSVRKYQKRKIEDELVSQIQAEIDRIHEECESEKNKLHFVFMEDAGNTFKNFKCRMSGLSSAPSYIACYCEWWLGSYQPVRVGYYGEKLVIFLQKLGLNTCWVGEFDKNHTNAEEKYGKDEYLEIVIAVGYGKDQGQPHESKNTDQITVKSSKRDKTWEYPEWFLKGLEYALFAPTLNNEQKCEFFCYDDKVSMKYYGAHTVSTGTMLCHFDIGAGTEFVVHKVPYIARSPFQHDVRRVRIDEFHPDYIYPEIEGSPFDNLRPRIRRAIDTCGMNLDVYKCVTVTNHRSTDTVDEDYGDSSYVLYQFEKEYDGKVSVIQIREYYIDYDPAMEFDGDSIVTDHFIKNDIDDKDEKRSVSNMLLNIEKEYERLTELEKWNRDYL